MADDNVNESAGRNANTGGATPVRGEPNHLRRAIIIWVVLSIIGMVVVIITSPYILPVAATDLDTTDNITMEMLTILSVPVALFVFVFLIYSLIVFRVNGRPTEDAIVMKPMPGLQISWMGITGALCLFLVIWGLFGFYEDTTAAPANQLVVKVTAQQWLWTFDYPQYGISSQGQVLELPVNRPVEFDVTSDDVLHGFAIQAFGVRVDANPGEVTNTPLVTPSQIGSYAVRCVELCGLYHSYMWSSVQVVSTTTFNSWIVSQGGNP
ncbi:MAG: cytochrome c oxidase subunit II [Ktedonobacteraceae bacterium]